MCYTDIFLVKKGLCVKLGFVCVTTIDPLINIFGRKINKSERNVRENQ